MNKYLIAAAVISSIAMVGCDRSQSETEKTVLKAEQKADEARRQMSDPQEQKAIADRSNMMNKPGLMMYTLVLGDMNTPLAYMTTGRIVSGGKRLNAPDYLYCSAAGNCSWRAAPNLDGTYGSSGDYVYFWTTSGVYWQVPANKVISSSHPIRLNDTTKIHIDIADAKAVAAYNKSVEQSESAASK